MCCGRQRDNKELDDRIGEIECQIALQRDLIDWLESTGKDTSKAALGLAMLLVMLRQVLIARDTARPTSTIGR
ncbi:hypothetical protein [Vineibacter terrae]|uniref:hypothetical protein n=1 Tax=Vineibacter terrae TaxID=2586908 RepID=UPI002E336C00|nr:hypothetical protein [Vineibacter terrae]HEX2888325.1 hypothetical protein [Vineibacter terrae]